MEFLPQELVDAIVCKIDDNPSLKACALAGRMFCERSQRIILQSLTLRSPHSNFGRVHALLEESPHIAAYITHLTIRLRWDTPAADIQSLQQILGKLENVRRCTIGGMSFLFSLGYYHSPTFQSVLLDFLAHQPLRELYVQFTNAPPAIILRLFTIAPPMLFFSSVGVKAESEDPMLGAQKNAPKIDHLVLGQSTRKVHQLLTRPQLESYTQGLRRLSIFPHHDPSNKLLFRTAETLQYINFNLGPIPTPDIPVPPLPLLRSVAFSLPLCNHTIPRFSDFISTILGAAPLLAYVTISLFQLSREEFEAPQTLALDAVLLAALDAALAALPTSPTMRWRLNFTDGFNDEPARAERFAEFSAAVQSGMPKMREEGRLVLERYVLPPGASQSAGTIP